MGLPVATLAMWVPASFASFMPVNGGGVRWLTVNGGFGLGKKCGPGLAWPQPPSNLCLHLAALTSTLAFLGSACMLERVPNELLLQVCIAQGSATWKQMYSWRPSQNFLICYKAEI